jgi:hypothetical protein
MPPSAAERHSFYQYFRERGLFGSICAGGAYRIRTCDTWVKSPPVHPLLPAETHTYFSSATRLRHERFERVPARPPDGPGERDGESDLDHRQRPERGTQEAQPVNERRQNPHGPILVPLGTPYTDRVPRTAGELPGPAGHADPSGLGRLLRKIASSEQRSKRR